MSYQTVRLLQASLLSLALATSPGWARPSGFGSHASSTSAAKSQTTVAAKTVDTPKKVSGFSSGASMATPGTPAAVGKTTALGSSLYSAQTNATAADVYAKSHATLPAGNGVGTSGNGTGSLGGGYSGSAGGSGYGRSYGSPPPVVVQRDSGPGFFTGLFLGSLFSHHDTVVVASSGGSYPQGNPGQSAPSYGTPASGQGNSESHVGRNLVLIILILGAVGAVFFFTPALRGSFGRPAGTGGSANSSKKRYEL